MGTWKDEMNELFIRNVRNEVIKLIKGYVKTTISDNAFRISIFDRDNNLVYYRDYKDLEKLIYGSTKAESIGWDFYKHMQAHIRKKYFKPNSLR